MFGNEKDRTKATIDEFYNTTKKQEEQKNLRSSLIMELGDKLSPTQTLYSSIDELKQMKAENNNKTPTFPLNRLTSKENYQTPTGGASGVEDSTTQMNQNYYRTPIIDAKSREKYLKQNQCKVDEKKIIPGINACKNGILPINPGYKIMPKRNFINDDKFNEIMSYIYAYEGGFSDRKTDKGGRTNFGVTQNTFDDYNKKYNLPLRDVKNITYDEADKVYYNAFYKSSGADKIDDPLLALIHLDAAINHGVGNAKRFLKQSGDDFNKYYELRKTFYDSLNPTGQNENYNGWINRINKIKILQDFN